MIYYLVFAILFWLFFKLSVNSLSATELMLIKYIKVKDTEYPWKTITFSMLCYISSIASLIIFLIKVGNKFLG